DITNALLGLGKVFGKDELVRKLLGCLNDEWEPKVTAIEKLKDLKVMEIEELLGSLMTHEVKLNKKSANLVEKKPQEERRKDIALKSTHKEEISRSKMDPPTCFECNKPRHIKVDCPQLKKKKLFKNKALKAWHLSDDESSDHEVTEQVANLCFMASNEESDNEVDDSYTFGELQFAFDELLIEFKKKFSQYTSLKKNVASIENEKDLLVIENERLKNDISILEHELAKKVDYQEKEVESLKKKNVNLEKSFSKFIVGSMKLEEMLDIQRPYLDKTGIGYTPLEVKAKLKNTKTKP
ncbi:LOW QUALITY PROTEIN: zf-CCHC domain-containing protein/UBN2 domain-containing protein, partial [Cephalotus follicularis]